MDSELTPEDLEFLYGDPEVDPDTEDYADKPVEPPADYGQAAWMSGHAVRARRRAQEIRAHIASLRLKLTRIEEDLCGPHDRRAEWFEAGIESWHRAQLADGKDVGKHIEFPSGGASKLTRAQPVVKGRPDHDLLMAFCEEQGWDDVYKDPAGPDDRFLVSKLKGHVELRRGSEPGADSYYVDKKTGKRVPGLTLVERHDTWSSGTTPGRKAG